MKISFIAALTLIPIFAFAARYDCTTEFGESVPIRKLVLKKGVHCESCSEPSFQVPKDLLDLEQSKEWNPIVAEDPGLKASVKRRVFSVLDQLVLVDTRYATQAGPRFEFSLKCGLLERKSTCQGHFEPNANPMILDTMLFDQRLLGNVGRAEIQPGAREHLGWIVRVFKNSIPLPGGEPGRLSSSGELKIFREDPLFALDVGVDEHLLLGAGQFLRLAGFEIKIRCQRQNAPDFGQGGSLNHRSK